MAITPSCNRVSDLLHVAVTLHKKLLHPHLHLVTCPLHCSVLCAGPAGTSAAAAAAAAIQVDQQAGRSSDDDEAAEDVDRDMEDELINAVRAKGKDDPLAAYDMDVSEDGQAIQLYMSLLASASNTASSQGQ